MKLVSDYNQINFKNHEIYDIKKSHTEVDSNINVCTVSLASFVGVIYGQASVSPSGGGCTQRTGWYLESGY